MSFWKLSQGPLGRNETNCLSLQMEIFSRLVPCDQLVLFALTSPAGTTTGMGILQVQVTCNVLSPASNTIQLHPNCP